MDRLTKINKDGTATIDFDMLGTPFGKDTVYDIIELYHLACKHLAAYEDIGTVEDFQRLVTAQNEGTISEKLMLSMLAGARAIENNKRYQGTIFCHDVFGEHPQEISYFEAAQILHEEAEKKLKEGKGE